MVRVPWLYSAVTLLVDQTMVEGTVNECYSWLTTDMMENRSLFVVPVRTVLL